MTLQDFYYPPNKPAWNEGVYTFSDEGVKIPVPPTGTWVVEAMPFAEAAKEGVWTIGQGLIKSGQYFAGAGSLMGGGPTGVRIGGRIYPLARFELVATHGFTGGYHITFDNISVSGIPL